MSHIVTIQTEVRDPAAIAAACRRLQLAEPVFGTARLFSSDATGWQIQLPGWRYPVVADTERGQLHFDDFEGRWGDRPQIDRFLQMYAVERARQEARRQGHGVLEQPLADGSIKLTIQVGGSA
ncbi:MAG: DUF1257 domain-containing protein [Pirellulales bacterium]